MIHRVARQHLVPHREPEREPQCHPSLLGTVVALLRELLQEVVAAGDADLAQVRPLNAGIMNVRMLRSYS